MPRATKRIAVSDGIQFAAGELEQGNLVMAIVVRNEGGCTAFGAE
jgi:hypothetical protein